MAMAGGSNTENVHFAFIFGKQHGGELVRRRRQADFTSDGNVRASSSTST